MSLFRCATRERRGVEGFPPFFGEGEFPALFHEERGEGFPFLFPWAKGGFPPFFREGRGFPTFSHQAGMVRGGGFPAIFP